MVITMIIIIVNTDVELDSDLRSVDPGPGLDLGLGRIDYMYTQRAIYTINMPDDVTLGGADDRGGSSSPGNLLPWAVGLQ